MTNTPAAVAMLTTVLVLACHSFANDPYGWASTEPHGTPGFARPVAVHIVVYPFAALQDTLTPNGMAQVDPSTRTLLESAGVTRVEDLAYPFAALLPRSNDDAPVQVAPQAAATSHPSGASRVDILVYPFHETGEVPVASTTTD